MPPQYFEHYHVPFGNDANAVNHSGVAAIKIQQIFQNSSSTLARLARHPSAFTSMCGTDTAGRGALEPPPEGGARTKPYSTENSSSANRILRPRQKLLTKVHDTKQWLYIQGMILCIMFMFSQYGYSRVLLLRNEATLLSNLDVACFPWWPGSDGSCSCFFMRLLNCRLLVHSL